MVRFRTRGLRRLVAGVAGSVLALPGTAIVPAAAAVVMHPVVSDFVQMSTSTTPPTQAQCASAGRRCFSPQAIQAAYNVGPLYAQGVNQTWGLQPMCGEEGVACAPGMPTFSRIHVQGSQATKPIPGNGTTGQEDNTLWALEVALDVEMAHAMAPMANILLVTTPTAETLGVQGFPDMMNAEQYVIDHHLATVISQSFASAEDAFSSTQSLLNLRHAYVAAAGSAVTVLGSSG